MRETGKERGNGRAKGRDVQQERGGTEANERHRVAAICGDTGK